MTHLCIDVSRTDALGIGTFPGIYEVRLIGEDRAAASGIVQITWPLLRSRLSRVLAVDEARLERIGALLQQSGKTIIEDLGDPSSIQLKMMGFLPFSELASVVAAKVRAGDMFIDLRNAGFISAHVVQCPHCECNYRIFYRYPEAGPSAAEQQSRAVAFAAGISKSHPRHAEELIEGVDESSKAIQA